MCSVNNDNVDARGFEGATKQTQTRIRSLRPFGPCNDGFVAIVRKSSLILGCALAGLFFLTRCAFSQEQPRTYVILLSVDGLRPDALTTLGEKGAPNFYRLMKEGAFTLNARTDPDRTVTIPNHVCMITGRGVQGSKGHNFIDNRSVGLSIHANKGEYVTSVFDVVKDHGLSTALFASKLKFKVFINSYADTSGPRRSSRIDHYSLTDLEDEVTLGYLIKQLRDKPPVFSFVHFAQLDDAGHWAGWDLDQNSLYMMTVQQIDRNIGKILETIDREPFLAGRTVIVLTSDHGGMGTDHDAVTKHENFRIPLLIWGKGVARGKDLYKMNNDIRQDPGQNRIACGKGKQPIRNGDAANIVCAVLGLTFVPGSTIGNPDVLRFN